MNAIVNLPQQQTGRSLTAANVREHVNLIQEVMKAVMKQDTHYGVIPGCKQPSLYKAGSEVLLTTFRIAVSVHVEDLSTADCIRYRVRTVGTHQTTGVVVGEGIGECSSDETKYKWRRCYVKQEFEATPETRRRIKYAESKGHVYENMEVRTDPADVANTILKMAKKRAQIDLTLTATAASDIFTQDIEDMPEELVDREPEHVERAERAVPTAGTWEALDEKKRAAFLEHAERVKALCEVGDIGGAVDHIDSMGLNNDEKTALWTRFASEDRTLMKAETIKRLKAATKAAEGAK